MGRELYEKDYYARDLFEIANDILGFRITDIMFGGTEAELKQTRVTQPAIYLHSVILSRTIENFRPDMVAGHSLGEFSALAANKTLSFEDGLQLVYKRAMAMQKACEAEPSAMAAIIGLENDIVEKICNVIDEVVVPANYNSPGQIVISGSNPGIDQAIELMTAEGAKRAIRLPVGGAFHSPLMEPAKEELRKAIESTNFGEPICPVYQNVNASPSVDPGIIRENLISQLVSPVRWMQTVQRMIADGATSFTEVGPGNVLQGLIRKTDTSVSTGSV
jgi:[acyl-carrier-protein] S-malonyltransferase